MSGNDFVTRFAPSPTGRLHPGHAYSALQAYERARREGGRFLLRIEDIDTTRSRPEWVEGIFEDLAWLGLAWEEPVRFQSAHMADYAAALEQLKALGLLYPCFCTRKDIRAAIAASVSAPHGPLGIIYPGTCRALNTQERQIRIDAGENYALRLDVQHAVSLIGRAPLEWIDERFGRQRVDVNAFGDVVLARKDIPVSYHLAVTVDDALQGITHVIRGEDLLPATAVHRLLQALLDLPVPVYHHHALLYDDSGRRLAKRDGAETLAELRARGVTPVEFRGWLERKIRKE